MRPIFLHVCREDKRDKYCLMMWQHLQCYPGAIMRQSGPYIDTDFISHWFISPKVIDDLSISGLKIIGVSIYDITLTEEQNSYLLSRVR